MGKRKSKTRGKGGAKGEQMAQPPDGVPRSAPSGETATPVPPPASASVPVVRGLWDAAVRTGGEVPPPRGGHTATTLGGKLYIFGGADRSPRTLCDLHVLDLSCLLDSPSLGGAVRTMEWTRVARDGGGDDDDDDAATAGAGWPAPRSDHACAAVGQQLWVTGGQDQIGRAEAGCDSPYLPFEVWTYQPAEGVRGWALRACAGAPPMARACHTLVLAGDGSTLALMGGSSDEGPLADL
jgi:hypothetical protein